MPGTRSSDGEGSVVVATVDDGDDGVEVGMVIMLRVEVDGVVGTVEVGEVVVLVEVGVDGMEEADDVTMVVEAMVLDGSLPRYWIELETTADVPLLSRSMA